MVYIEGDIIKPITFTCKVSGTLPLSVNWHFINHNYRPIRIESYNTSVTGVREITSILTLDHITPASNGDYKCSVYNEDDFSIQKAILTVKGNLL